MEMVLLIMKNSRYLEALNCGRYPKFIHLLAQPNLSHAEIWIQQSGCLIYVKSHH